MLLPYDELVRLIDEMCGLLQESGEFIVRNHMSFAGNHVRTFSNRSSFVLVRAAAGEADQRSVVYICAGGAHGARPARELFEILLVQGLNTDWGGPFARVMPNGTVTYGSRLTISSDLMTSDNVATEFGFVLGMIRTLGETARRQAAELVPRFGGTLFDGMDRDSAFESGVELSLGLLGPPAAPPSQERVSEILAHMEASGGSGARPTVRDEPFTDPEDCLDWIIGGLKRRAEAENQPLRPDEISLLTARIGSVQGGKILDQWLSFRELTLESTVRADGDAGRADWESAYKLLRVKHSDLVAAVLLERVL